jgi:head completion protein GPL
MPFNPGFSSENTPENKVFSSEAFFPDVETDPFYKQYRLPGELPEELINDCLIRAIGETNTRLQAWKEARILEGYVTLATVPALVVNDESVKLKRYARAVYCLAKAEILKETVTVDRKEIAENAAKTSEETEDKYREFAGKAIRYIMGKRSVGVHVI